MQHKPCDNCIFRNVSTSCGGMCHDCGQHTSYHNYKPSFFPQPLPEEDPNGIPQHEPGAKLSKGKPDVEMVFESFPNALLELCKVAEFGAQKYSRLGFLKVPDAVNEYRKAAGRHKLKRLQGEELDVDSGFDHELHECWNLLAIIECKLRAHSEAPQINGSFTIDDLKLGLTD